MKEEKGNINDQILLNYLKGDVSVEDGAMVESWLNKGSGNKSRLDQLAKTWKHSESVADFESIEVEKDWVKVKARMNFKNKSIQPVSDKTRSLFYSVSRIAALLIVLIGVSYVLYNYGFGGGSEMIINTTLQNKADLVLTDGTKVFLNKSSEFSYPEKFNKRTREVHLKGEAFFEVARNEKLPFIINTPNGAKVQVLGTAFNVNTIDEPATTIVHVSEGKVALISSDKEIGKTVLVKDEMGVLSLNNLTKSSISQPNYSSWRTGILTFSNATIEDVIADLSKFYDTTILLKNNNLKYNKLTTLINNQTLDDVLEELKLVLNINYSSTDGSILIFKDD